MVKIVVLLVGLFVLRDWFDLWLLFFLVAEVCGIVGFLLGVSLFRCFAGLLGWLKLSAGLLFVILC